MFRAWENATGATVQNGLFEAIPENCTEHYRSSLVDRWEELNVTKVKFV